MGNRIALVTGAGGQIGTELLHALRQQLGVKNVIASDLRPLDVEGPFEVINVTDTQRISEVVDKYKITEIYHLAALLSSKGEQNIDLTWTINFKAYQDILAMSVEKGIDRIFFPSTIGIFGPTTPKQFTPQNTSFIPSTVYGISKITGELWGQYYNNRYGLDVRSLRFPGVISYEVLPVGGTTDFAVEIFFETVKSGHYTCYLGKDTRLPMIYMPDVIKATLGLMSADKSKLSTSMGYNIQGFSLTPEEVHNEIKKHIQEATIAYKPDARQKIADSWSETIDDSMALTDWDWRPEYDMSSMTVDMIKHLSL